MKISVSSCCDVLKKIFSRDSTFTKRFNAFILHETYPLYFLLLAGLLFRIFIMLGVDGFMWPDSKGYYHGAVRILSRGIFTHQLIYRTPLYPAFLALFLKFGHTYTVGMMVMIFQHIMGLASVLLIYKSTRMVFSPLTAFVTALLINFHTLLLYYENVVQTEVLFLFLLSLTVYLFLKTLENGKIWKWITLGALLGLLTLARPIGQLLILALVPVIWWKYGNLRKTILLCLITAIMCFLVMLPWMLSTKREYGFLGICHLQGVQLFHKAFDKARLDFPADTRHPEVDTVAKIEQNRKKHKNVRIDWLIWQRLQKEYGFSQLRSDQEMFAYTLEALRQDPWLFIKDTFFDFITFFWNAKPSICVKKCETGPYLSAPHGSRFGNSTFHSGPVKRFPWVRKRLSSFFKHHGLPIKPLIILSLIGIAVFFRTKKTHLAEGLAFVIIPLYLGFFTTLFETYQDRYRLPADPFIFAFSVFALETMIRKFTGSMEKKSANETKPAVLPSINNEPGIPDISVVILCYRAQEFVPVFVAQVKEVLSKNNLSFELVLVANYHIDEKESDKTPEIVENLAREDSRIKVIAKEKQGMMGWDMQSGLVAARGKTVAIIDGDGQMPPEDIIRVYKMLMDGNYDMAKTYRSHRYDGPLRILISRVYNTMLKILFPKVRVHDANSKPRIFRHDALGKINLTADDWFIDAEIVIQASYLGLKIGEVPTVFRANEYRTSFVKPTAIFEFIRNLIIYRFKHWRGF